MIANLDDVHVEVLLSTQHVGRIGCASNGRAYVVPVSYVYENGCVYGHTNEGLKMQFIRKNPLVCFEVDVMENLENWRSVIAWGEFEELDGDEAADALSLIFSRLTPAVVGSKDPSDVNLDESLAKATKLRPTKGVTYRIRLTEKSGRYERNSGQPTIPQYQR